jgi:hypothetical protein
MAIELIQEFTSDYDFNKYNTDRKTQSAVERQLAIIGEALNHLKKMKNPLELRVTNKLLLLEQARYLDKLVDELAKGKKMEKILRVG